MSHKQAKAARRQEALKFQATIPKQVPQELTVMNQLSKFVVLPTACLLISGFVIWLSTGVLTHTVALSADGVRIESILTSIEKLDKKIDLLSDKIDKRFDRLEDKLNTAHPAVDAAAPAMGPAQ